MAYIRLPDPFADHLMNFMARLAFGRPALLPLIMNGTADTPCGVGWYPTRPNFLGHRRLLLPGCPDPEPLSCYDYFRRHRKRLFVPVAIFSAAIHQFPTPLFHTLREGFLDRFTTVVTMMRAAMARNSAESGLIA